MENHSNPRKIIEMHGKSFKSMENHPNPCKINEMQTNPEISWIFEILAGDGAYKPELTSDWPKTYFLHFIRGGTGRVQRADRELLQNRRKSEEIHGNQ